MACQIKRDSNGNIAEVLAPNNKPSILYSSLVDSMSNSIFKQNVLNDRYVSSILDTEYIKDTSNEEVALAAWSKAYTANFIDTFGDWKDTKLPNTDSNGEPLLNTLFDFETIIPKSDVIKSGVEELFESNPELANQVYEALGFRLPNITVLPNGNLKIVAFRTEKTSSTSKGEYQRGKGLYLSLDKPYPGEDVYTVEIEVSPKNLLDRKLGFGEISEDYFINEKNKRVDKQLDTLHQFKQSLGIKAEIGSIDGALINELVLFDKELIDKALASKQVYNQQQKQQAQQLYSSYLDAIFPDYIDNFAYEAVEELLVVNKIIDRKC